ARGSPPVPVLRTGHETFALIRLLARLTVVSGTSLRFARSFPMHRIMAVPVKDHQPLDLLGGPLDMMHLQQAGWCEVQATVRAPPSLAPDDPAQPEADARVLSPPCHPVHPIPVERAPVPLHLHVTLDLGRVMAEQGRSLLRAEDPVGEVPVLAHNPPTALLRVPPVGPAAEGVVEHAVHLA